MGFGYAYGPGWWMAEGLGDLHARAADLFEGLAGRLPAYEVDVDGAMLSAGEWKFFADGLAGFLYRWRCPITPGEFDALREILHCFRIPVRDGRLINRARGFGRA